MRAAFSGLWLAALLFSSSLAPRTAEAARPKLLFQEIRGQAGTEALRVQQVSFQVCSELSRLRKYEVMCAHEQLIASKKTPIVKKFAKCSRDACFGQVGKAVGARYAVYGNLTKGAEMRVLTLYLFDVKTGASKGRRTATGKSIADVIKALPKAIKELPFAE